MGIPRRGDAIGEVAPKAAKAESKMIIDWSIVERPTNLVLDMELS